MSEIETKFWIPIDANIPHNRALLIAYISPEGHVQSRPNCTVEELPINPDAILFDASVVPEISFDDWPYDELPDPTHYHIPMGERNEPPLPGGIENQ